MKYSHNGWVDETFSKIIEKYNYPKDLIDSICSEYLPSFFAVQDYRGEKTDIKWAKNALINNEKYKREFIEIADEQGYSEKLRSWIFHEPEAMYEIVDDTKAGKTIDESLARMIIIHWDD